MKIPKIINKKKKRFEYIGKVKDNMYMYQDQYGIRETFSKFDLGGIDNRDIDEYLTENKRIRIYGRIYSRKYKIIVHDYETGTTKEYLSTQDLAEELNTTQNTINTIIANGKKYRRRYKIERVYYE